MNFRFAKTAALIAVGLSSFLLGTPAAHALSFTPSEAEWLAWPDYCRARYVDSGAGKNSRFVARISAAQLARQQAKLGDAWGWLHHHCAGLAYIQRASAESTDRMIQYWLREAEKNLMGYHRRMLRLGRNGPMYIEVVTSIAQVHRKRGDITSAIRLLDEAMARSPTSSSSYALASMIYKESGDRQQALSVLLKGNQALSGESAEIHYFLGHAYLEMGDLDLAVEHAKLAYGLGYPLPGLATRLRRQGRTLD